MAEQLVLPRVHALIVCDEVEQSPDDERVFNLIGVRTAIRAPSYPYTHPGLSVYLQLSGHEGTASGNVVVVNARTDEEVFYQPTPDYAFLGPLVVLQAGVRFESCTFPEPGLYYVQVYFGQKLVHERPFRATNGEVISNGR